MKSKQILTSLILLIVGVSSILASETTSLLMPKPRQLTENGASFPLNREVAISDPTGSALLASLFNVSPTASATVTVRIVDATILGTFDYELAGFPNEGYQLNVTADAITVTAATKTGVVRAAQTLMQLAAATKGASIPGVSITDYPAFKLRGYMHDVGRSFISFDELKKEIDLLSRFKVNVFHWHLTDNQGFRFESKTYPQLNQAANMTRFAGSYYTQAQCTELEAYAAERGVIVVPEIDMPGHSAAFTTAMGYTMSSDEGKVALKALLSELAAAFPLAPYIHMGADEAGTTAAFVNEMSQYIKETLGRKCIVWNPISGVDISTSTLPYIDMTEMWSTSGRKIEGVPNIDCRYNYINHFDVFADLVGIYKSNVYYAQQGSSEVAGAITAIWNDRKTATETDIISQNGLYAHALATAERGWIGGGNQYIEAGGTTLPNSGSEFEEFADWERRFLHYKDTWLAGEPIPYVKQTNVRWRITQPFPNGGTASAVFPPETAANDILPDEFSYNGQTYTTSMATGAGIYLRHVWGTTVPAFFSSPQLNTTAYAWTYVYSPTAQTAGALIEFQNYSRSENDKAPDAGNWDRKGSRIWVNGEEVAPPAWTNSGVNINSEVDLGNENFPAREPISISLHAGWNKVLLKLPYVNASNIRLNKWMFTFVLTDPTGRNALEGITYSPIQSLDANVGNVVALIGEVKQHVNENCGTTIGYYPLSAASTLMAKVEEIEGTLQSSLTAEQREAQETELQTAFNAFKSGLSSQPLNQPLTSSGSTNHYYTLCTPLRGTRYATAAGTDAELAGTPTLSNLSYWKFVERTDGKLDIVNAVNGSYIAPNSTNNTVLKTQASQPSAGWAVGKAATAGYVIIASGSCQFNQTNTGSPALSGGYKIFNWGGGANTTDTGCQYLIEEADVSFDEDDVLDGGETSDGTRVVNVGNQVTTEAGITSGKVYILKTGADRYITDNGTNYDVPNSANSSTEASAYYLISNGDGTWKIKNYYTGKYWGVPVYNSYLASAAEASAGAWSFNFSNGIAYPSAPDASNTMRGIDRSGGKVHGWSTGDNSNHKVYIYEVSLSTATAFNDFIEKDIQVGADPASTISTGAWYLMSQRSRTSYVFEDVSSHTLKHTLTKPSGQAATNANYLFRIVGGTGGKFYLQNGLGNYVGQIAASTNVPTTAMKEQQHTVAKISGANGHYYVQCGSNNVVLDANDFSYGDPSTVVGWGTSVPSSTGGNNDWAFYPVELVDSWVPTASDVYTINNTKASNRGALVYDGTSANVGLVASASLNATNANHQWVLCPAGIEKQYYLYNVGAGKFAIPTSIAQSANNAWVFSDNAVAVTLVSQGDGTYRIKMATTPVSGTNEAVIGVNQNTAIKVFNYADTGSDFTFTKVDGADHSAAANAAVGKLVKSQTALASYPQVSGWYAIQIKSKTGAASYAGRYLQTAATLYNGLYPLTFTGAVDVQPSITDPTFFTYISCTSWDNNNWQLPDGRYLVDNGSNKFPTPSTTAGNVICGYDNGSYFKTNSNYYADPYNSGANYYIGETTSMRTAYTVYPIDLAAAGLTAWKVAITNAGSSTQLTCNRPDVSGLASVYSGGYIFLPSGVTPATTDFAMEGMFGAPIIDNTTNTITANYDPSVCFLASDVAIIQGNETTGKGNTMQALLRVKVTPFAACTPSGVSVTLAGADQLDRVAVYTTSIDELHAAAASPVKLGELTVPSGSPEGSITIPTPAAPSLTAATPIYLWITADVKADATELATVDAAITAISYTNAYGSNTCDLTTIGNPDGAMRIYKQQTALWTPDHANTIYYRIPTILRTGDNNIVALADYRHDHPYDLGKSAGNGLGPHVIDVVARRSTDGGLTWHDAVTVAAGDGVNDASYGYGDPAIVADADGNLHCLMAAGSTSYASGTGMLHMGYSKSTDGGATWSAVTDVYDAIDKAGLTISSAFTTGGTGVTFANGRMAFAFLGKVNGTTNVYPLYSDDKGATWQLSPAVAYGGGDESKFEIMNDNSLLVSVRKGGFNGTALRAYNRTTGDASGDGIGFWGAPADWGSEMNANGCNADILYYNRSADRPVSGDAMADIPDVIFHTLTKSYSTYRRDLRLYMSFDQGATWKEAFQLQPGYAAYSSMQKLANGDLAIIYEDGSIGNKDKQDCYAMNYIVLSREVIKAKIDELNDYHQQASSDFGPYFEESATGYFALTPAAKSELIGEYTSLCVSCSAAQYNAFAAKVKAGLLLPADGGYYRIRTSLQPSSYDRGTAGQYYYLSLDGSDLLSLVGSQKQADYSTVFKFTKVADYQYKLQSQGLYVQNYVRDNAVLQLTGADNTIAVNVVSPGIINLRAGTSAHANLHHSQNKKNNAADAYKVVGWTWDGGASQWVIEDAVGSTIPVSLKPVGTASYATLFLPFDVTTDASTKAYFIKSVSDDSALLTEVANGEIAARTAVVLVNNSGSAATFNVASGLTSQVTEEANLLKGTLTGITGLDLSDDTPNYSLGVLENSIGFYKFNNSGTTTINLGANKAYLNTTTSSGGGVKGFAFSFDFVDGIGQVDSPEFNAEASYGNVYDVSGRLVKKPTRGMYIVRGKKVVVK